MTAFDSKAGVPWKQEPGTSARERESFRLALAGLVGVAICVLAIGAGILLRQTNASPKPPPLKWSTFKPDAGSADSQALEIGEYVSLEYQAGGGTQFTAITPVMTASLDESLGTYTGAGLDVAVSPTGPNSDLTPLPGTVVAYDLCGVDGANCSLGIKPSRDLELLAKRQAFELALYTFEYVKNTQYVAILLPYGLASGKHASTTTEAVLFRRKELASLLTEPLKYTLEATPPAITELTRWSKTEEAANVEAYTANNLYNAKVAQEQGGSSLLELYRLPTQY